MKIIIKLIKLINLQDILEENIRIEREHKKEIAAKKIPTKKEDPTAMLGDEEVSDRAPILHAIIDKWKYFIKEKKRMLDRYIKNSAGINDAFSKMAKFLGTENFEMLPIIIEKMEAQNDSITKFISQCTEEQNILELKRRTLEKNIAEIVLT